MRAFGTDQLGNDVSNVVVLNATPHRQARPQRLTAHAALFAQGRRREGDVFWLKENAEFLNILDCTGQDGDAVMEAYSDIYARIDTLLGNYPQYYRFFLSICLDLEDLGMSGQKGLAMCCWARVQRLAEAELSDLQRAEACRLLERRGVMQMGDDLRARLHRFINRSATFAIPNKKAAYELTHIVFYLSNYGRRDPFLDAGARRSLIYAGLMAYLEQNFDLLAEVCVAMRYGGMEPDAIWEACVMRALSEAYVEDTPGAQSGDDYHCYLVSNWLSAMGERSFLPLKLPSTSGLNLKMGAPSCCALRELGKILEDRRDPDWVKTRDAILSDMTPEACDVLRAAEDSTEHFEAFFEQFARASSPSAISARLDLVT